MSTQHIFDQHFMQDNPHRSYLKPPSVFMRCFPSISFYLDLAPAVIQLFYAAQRNKCTDAAWVYASAGVARVVEKFCPLHIEGMEHIDAPQGPCVYVANHMSTLETFVLPSIIRPRRPVTFITKESLLRVPFFGAVLQSRQPITIKRQNPREDLQAVLEGGVERLSRGISIIVFPQSTRSQTFAPEKFNTIGIKLAKKANVPIVPLALLTDAWGQGKHIKDLGEIQLGKTVRFRFGPPMHIHEQGKQEHAHICSFIATTLQEWQGM